MKNNISFSPPLIFKIFFVTIFYFFSGRLGVMMAIPPGIATAVWPPSGLALVAVLLWKRDIWPGIWLGSMLVNFGLILHAADAGEFALNFAVIAAIAAGSTFQALAGGFLIQRFIQTSDPFDSVKNVFKFFALEALSCIAAPSLGTLSLALASMIPWSGFVYTWRTWWLGDWVGAIVMAPLLLLLMKNNKPMDSFKKRGWAMLEMILSSFILVFQTHLAFSQHFFYVYSLFPSIAWAAFRFQHWGTALTILTVSFFALWNTLQGNTSFTRLASNMDEAVWITQFFVGFFSLTGLIFSAALTERRRAEEELEATKNDLQDFAKTLNQSNKELEHFAYVASHELQEPVRIVTMYLELFLKRYGKNLEKEAREFVEIAQQQSMRFQKTIQALLQYARVDSKEKTFHLTEFTSILKQTIRNLELSILENNVEIEWDPLPQVYADPFQMVQLMQNLLSNAIKYRRESPLKIFISAKRTPKECIFSVQDNGIGIEPQHLDKIFQIFKRIDPRREGAGLGLAICKKIVERHQGKIWVESEPLKGSSFFFTLPLASQEPSVLSSEFSDKAAPKISAKEPV